MTLEYDVKTRRIKIQITEEAFRALEKIAIAEKASVSKIARRILEEAMEEYLDVLTDEDQLVIAKRVQANIEKRIQKRKGN